MYLQRSGIYLVDLNPQDEVKKKTKRRRKYNESSFFNLLFNDIWYNNLIYLTEGIKHMNEFDDYDIKNRYNLDLEYDDVYDEDGDVVYCDRCGSEIKWKDGQYTCPNCGQIMSREIFFNYIGADPPSEACLTCDNLYPGCAICPYGCIDDDC